MSLAADDRHLIAEIEEGNGSDLWMIDLEQGTRSRITSDAKSEGSPVLSPDGRLVAFASDRNGVDDLFRKRADGVGDEQVLLKSTRAKVPHRLVASLDQLHEVRFDAKAGSVDARAGWRREPYLQTEFSEQGGRLSPDERWMLYASDEAGPNAIYLRPFPDVNGGKWRVSGAGAAFAPRWRADGKEIFYVGDGGQLMAVVVQPDGQTPVLIPPKPLFQPTSLTRSMFAVSRDGTRILLPVRGTVNTADTPLSVVLNWPTLFSRR